MVGRISVKSTGKQLPVWWITLTVTLYITSMAQDENRDVNNIDLFLLRLFYAGSC